VRKHRLWGSSRVSRGLGTSFSGSSTMTVLAVTRLSVRSLRFLPGFIWHAVRSERQARNAQGCVATDVRREKLLVFWTRTAWRDEAAMRAYMTSGAHKKVMPKLRHWCNEASLVHWSDAVGQTARLEPRPGAAATRRTRISRTLSFACPNAGPHSPIDLRWGHLLGAGCSSVGIRTSTELIPEDGSGF
jgi:quinol monooxygenase YgiN